MQDNIENIDISKIDNITFDIAQSLITNYYYKHKLFLPNNGNINIPFIVCVRLRNNTINIWGDKISKAVTTAMFVLIPNTWTKGVMNNKYGYIYDFTNYSIAYISKNTAIELKHRISSTFGQINNNAQYPVSLNDIVIGEGEDISNKEDSVDTINKKVDKISKKQENKDKIKAIDKDLDENISSVGMISKEVYDMEKLASNFTKRQMACILLKVPDSGSEWLDILILNSKK